MPPCASPPVSRSAAVRVGAVEQSRCGIDHKALDPDCTRITAALRQTLRENLEATLEEWREALDAQPGEAWLRELMNAQCSSLALKALESLGWL